MSEVATQVSLSTPSLASVMHDYYKDQPNDEATLEQKIAIQEGRDKLPSGSRIRLDCNPTFEPAITDKELKAGKGNLLRYPGWEWRLLRKDSDEVLAEGTIGAGDENYAIDGFVGISSPENPEGAFKISNGYAPWFNLDAFDGPTRIEVRTKAPGMESPWLRIPWVESK